MVSRKKLISDFKKQFQCEEEIKVKNVGNYQYVFVDDVKMATLSLITGKVYGATKYFKYLGNGNTTKYFLEHLENKNKKIISNLEKFGKKLGEC